MNNTTGIFGRKQGKDSVTVEKVEIPKCNESVQGIDYRSA